MRPAPTARARDQGHSLVNSLEGVVVLRLPHAIAAAGVSVSAPLHDVRAKVDENINALLDAYAAARQITKAEVVRDVLREWADKELQLHRKVSVELKRSGLSDRGEPQGRKT